jgi:GxxExxY protein
MENAELTHKIIGCAFSVHNFLGNGFQELIYHRALAVEFRHQGIVFESEKEMKIFYRKELVGVRRVDFWIENQIMLEIKAVSLLENVHLAQAMNYLEAYQVYLGLLINFGGKSVEWKRVYNNKIIK